MNDMESEKYSPIVPEDRLVTGAVDMDYWCKVERERVTTQTRHVCPSVQYTSQ
jgi:hypothetical protein